MNSSISPSKVIHTAFAAVAALCIASPAQAHLGIGIYTGTLENGKPCSFRISSVTFPAGIKHPLNERVALHPLMAFVPSGFELSHLPQIDPQQKTVAFEGDVLTGTVGLSAFGAWAARLHIDHSPGKDGPSQLTLVFQDYKNPAGSEKLVCSNLTFKKD